MPTASSSAGRLRAPTSGAASLAGAASRWSSSWKSDGLRTSSTRSTPTMCSGALTDEASKESTSLSKKMEDSTVVPARCPAPGARQRIRHPPMTSDLHPTGPNILVGCRAGEKARRASPGRAGLRWAQRASASSHESDGPDTGLTPSVRPSHPDVQNAQVPYEPLYQAHVPRARLVPTPDPLF